jgi:hypothetical protein
MLPKVKVSRAKRPYTPILPSPHKPRFDTGNEPELFVGEVQGKKASQPEERLAKALNKSKSVQGYEFRRTMGAPHGLPGWFELDFTVNKGGITYAIEVDTEFTHRSKSGRGDVLHDAKVLKSLKGQGMQVWPTVIHLMGEDDLVDDASAERTVKRLFQ